MNLQSLGLKSEDKERRWLLSIYSYRGCVCVCVMDVCILCLWGVGLRVVLSCSISWQVFFSMWVALLQLVANPNNLIHRHVPKMQQSYYLKNKIHSTLASVAENLGELATRRCLCICTAWKPRSPCWLLPSFVLLWPVISKANMSWKVMSLDLTPYVKWFYDSWFGRWDVSQETDSCMLYGTVGVISGRSTLRFAFSQCFGCS